MNDNKIILEFLAKSQNEAFARVAVAAFISVNRCENSSF